MGVKEKEEERHTFHQNMNPKSKLAGGNDLVSMEDQRGKGIIWEAMSINQIEESANSSVSSLSSSDDLVEEDASSATSYPSSSSSSNGPLYELSELMAQLPMKRGLSKYYQGKSQTFTSLRSVKSIGDLAKKGRSSSSYSMRMKSCKSYGWGLEGHNKSYSPRATISKKATTTRGSCLLSSLGKGGALVNVNVPSPS